MAYRNSFSDQRLIFLYKYHKYQRLIFLFKYKFSVKIIYKHINPTKIIIPPNHIGIILIKMSHNLTN